MRDTTNYENVVSQNPKINVCIAQGMSEQLAKNELLISFRLVNYRLSPGSWTVLGRGLSNTKNLRNFGVNACNLYESDNLRRLLQGMTIDVNSHVETSSPTRAQEQTRPNRILSDKKREPKEPFTYNHKPVVTKINPRETARQKMARDTSQRTFGASIE